MTHPIYRPPQPPLTREDVDAMIAQKIAKHTRDGIVASAGGAVVLGALVWAVVAQ